MKTDCEITCNNENNENQRESRLERRSPVFRVLVGVEMGFLNMYYVDRLTKLKKSIGPTISCHIYNHNMRKINLVFRGDFSFGLRLDLGVILKHQFNKQFWI